MRLSVSVINRFWKIIVMYTKKSCEQYSNADIGNAVSSKLNEWFTQNQTSKNIVSGVANRYNENPIILQILLRTWLPVPRKLSTLNTFVRIRIGRNLFNTSIFRAIFLYCINLLCVPMGHTNVDWLVWIKSSTDCLSWQSVGYKFYSRFKGVYHRFKG